MIISLTGHRSDKLGSYTIPNPIYNHVCKNTEYALKELNPEKVYSGMALGYDMYGAFICSKLGIPFVAAIPFIGQESKWNSQYQKIYNSLLKKASEVVVVSEGSYSAHKMQVRNEYMCDRADIVLACYNFTSGGTANCVSYAYKTNKHVIVLDPIIERFNQEIFHNQVKTAKEKYGFESKQKNS